MNFCSKCDNMFYIKLDDSKNNIIYYCRNCGNTNSELTKDDIIITKYSKLNEFKPELYVNKYTKYDPTLPTTSNIPCPNQLCPSVKMKEVNNVIYIRYDHDNLNYIYLCNHCDKIWKQ